MKKASRLALSRLLPWQQLLTFSMAFSQAENSLLPPVRHPNGWLAVSGHVRPDQVINLQASSNLLEWSTVALLDHQTQNPDLGTRQATNEGFSYLDPAAASTPRRLYRFFLSTRTATNDWKNQVLFPNDAFITSESGADGSLIRWVKFAIVLSEPGRVYYQDSQKYLLHFDFASPRLGPFQNLTRAQFDQVSLFITNQQVLLGTLLFPPRPDLPEYGIQFAGRDPYPGEMIQRFFDLVRSTVSAPSGVVPYYFPAFEQSQAATIDEAYLARNGIFLSTPNRWIRGNQVYAPGWALGRLRRISATEINAACADGRLTAQDILLTDGVPAEVPFLAGIISTAPATPNSHVAILANGYGVPFVFLV